MVPCGGLHGQCSVSAGILDIIQHTYLRNIFLLELSQLPQAFFLAVPVPVPGSVYVCRSRMMCGFEYDPTLQSNIASSFVIPGSTLGVSQPNSWCFST